MTVLPAEIDKNTQPLWAKSYKVRLSEHTKNVMEIMNLFVQRYKDIAQKAAFFHDLGKVDDDFQEWITTYRRNTNLPHQNVSLLFIPKDEHVIRQAVFYHHPARVSFDKDKFIQCCNQQECSEIRKVFRTWVEKILYEFRNEYFLPYIQYIVKNIEEVNPIMTKRRHDSLSDFLKGLYITGVLIRADHLASYLEKESQSVVITVNNQYEIKIHGSPQCQRDTELVSIDTKPLTSDEICSTICNTIKKKVNIDKLWQEDILHKIDLRNKNVVLVAPTGVGKTEFAFMWSAGEKLIYTLPFQAAVNSIYNRVKKYVGSGRASLLHANANLFADSIDDIFLTEMSRRFIYPYLVTTGDQIAPAALEHAGYQVVYSALIDSKLVVDEVQAYNPQQVAIILKLLRDVKCMNSNFLLMTATLPPFVKKKIKEIDRDVVILNLSGDDKGYKTWKDTRRHRVKFIDIGSENKRANVILENIKPYINKKVLIIVNTVKTAQEIYKHLKRSFKETGFIKLLHSRFTLEDRKRHEEGLETEDRPFILVATQVIEASLDINADVLFTELAPIDSLVQRMGRVNRRAIFGDFSEVSNIPNVYIFHQSGKSFSSRPYNSELVYTTFESLSGLVEQQHGILSEYDKQKLVNDVYSKVFENKNNRYKQDFEDAYNFLFEDWERNREIFFVRTKRYAHSIFRRIDNKDIILDYNYAKYINEVREKRTEDPYHRYRVISKYIISLPRWLLDESESRGIVVKQRVEVGKRTIYVVNNGEKLYDTETGFWMPYNG